MEQIEIKNAIINSASINMGDRGLLTADLQLEYGDGSMQCFGGFALYLPKAYSNYEIKSYAGHFIFRCMQIADVEDWKERKIIEMSGFAEQMIVSCMYFVTF